MGLRNKRATVTVDQALADVDLVPVFVLNCMYEIREAGMHLVRPIELRRCGHYDDLRENPNYHPHTYGSGYSGCGRGCCW